jgi:hypothetical protein
MTDELWVTEDLEGNGAELIEVLYHRFPEETGEKPRKVLSSAVSR